MYVEREKKRSMLWGGGRSDPQQGGGGRVTVLCVATHTYGGPGDSGQSWSRGRGGGRLVNIEQK